jgi:hypothetical protein
VTSHVDRPFCIGIPRVARRLPGIARRRLPRVPVLTGTDPSGEPTPERAAASAARTRMRQLMGRPGGRGVTVTMIVNALASEQQGVPRSTIRRWLADDIQRGLAERAGPGFYRLRQHADPRSQHRRRRSRLAHPEHPKAGTTDRRRTGAIPPARRPRGRSGAGPPAVRQAAACKGASSGACSRRMAVCRAGEAPDRAARHRSAAKRALPAWPASRWSPASTPCPARRGGAGANAPRTLVLRDRSFGATSRRTRRSG